MAFTTQDAPDYTLLSDVNVIGSVTLDVKVVGSVTINVNVTNSQLNVYITNTILDVRAEITNAVLDVYITNTVLDVNANVTNTVLNVNATIVESQVTFNVNVVNAQLNVNVVNATLNVNVTNQVLQTSIPKPCLSFDGVDDYVDCGVRESLKLSSAITIMGWFRFDPSAPGSRGFVQKGATASEYDYMLYLSAAGYPGIYIKNPAGTVYHATHPTDVRDWKWRSIAGVFDGRFLRLYLDALLRTTTDTGGTTIRTTDSPLYIAHGFGGYARMQISQLLVYNRALTESEIKYNHDNPENPVISGLVLWLKFDEGAGSVAHDSSGYGNHGTIYGAKWVSSVGPAPATINVNITASQAVLNVKAEVVNAVLNVNVTNSVLNVNANVTNTVLNVNATIVASQVTFNVNVTAQAVDLKIYTPSGKWVVASDLLPAFKDRYIGYAYANQETTVKEATGRGRLRTLTFLVFDMGTPFDIANRIRIRVYVDGSLRFEISLIGVDGLSGYPVDYLRLALTHHLASGLAMPFNTARYGTSPDRYLIVPPHVSPIGGLTMAVWDNTNSRYRVMAGYINLGMEYTSSLKIAVYNSDTANTANLVMSWDIGEYL